MNEQTALAPVTLEEKSQIFFTEKLLTEQVGNVRHRLANGAVEDPGPLMLNRHAVTGFERPHLVLPAHQVRKLINFPAQPAREEPQPEGGLTGHGAETFSRLLRSQDAFYLRERGMSTENIAAFQVNRRRMFWRIAAEARAGGLDHKGLAGQRRSTPRKTPDAIVEEVRAIGAWVGRWFAAGVSPFWRGRRHRMENAPGGSADYAGAVAN